MTKFVNEKKYHQSKVGKLFPSPLEFFRAFHQNLCFSVWSFQYHKLNENIFIILSRDSWYERQERWEFLYVPLNLEANLHFIATIFCDLFFFWVAECVKVGAMRTTNKWHKNHQKIVVSEIDFFRQPFLVHFSCSKIEIQSWACRFHNLFTPQIEFRTIWKENSIFQPQHDTNGNWLWLSFCIALRENWEKFAVHAIVKCRDHSGTQ